MISIWHLVQNMLGKATNFAADFYFIGIKIYPPPGFNF